MSNYQPVNGIMIPHTVKQSVNGKPMRADDDRQGRVQLRDRRRVVQDAEEIRLGFSRFQCRRGAGCHALAVYGDVDAQVAGGVPVCLAAASVRSAQEKPAPRFDSAFIGDLRARAIGPAVMSGRIAALDVVAGDPRIIYAGSAGGGVWKSVNAGLTFAPVFDDHPMSIGAVTIDQARPDTVWVGTGEAWTRNSVSVGQGIYRSTDAGGRGGAWGSSTANGLPRSPCRPRQSDTVFACAVGQLWGSNDERGVFKTTDGGKTWKKVLFVDARTGCADVEIDPQEPSTMYAGDVAGAPRAVLLHVGRTWQRPLQEHRWRRAWTRVTRGLPDASARSHRDRDRTRRAPGTVYALVESRDTRVYRSDDTGESWRADRRRARRDRRSGRGRSISPTCGSIRRTTRASTTRACCSACRTNGGRTFELLTSEPRRCTATCTRCGSIRGIPQHLVLGTDGGVYVSRDRGATWAMAGTLPVSQFYHVACDMQRPYNVYGGLQDNGSWYGPSRCAPAARSATATG